MNVVVSRTRKMVVTAMLSALAVVLMFLDFSVGIMPSFIKMDFSELPALIDAFAFGPLWGAAVCLIKNLVNLIRTSTGGVGELSNFVLGCCFVIPAGLVYKFHKNRKGALIGSVAGAAAMAVLSLFTNYYVMYPLYTNFMPMEVIIGMYKAIYSGIDGLWEALIKFNLPFTFVKGLCDAAICFIIYKPLSPVIKGTMHA